MLNSANLIEIEKSSKIENTENYRVFPITKQDLLKDGVDLSRGKILLKDPEHLPYVGSKWGGKYLRAPDIFFTVLEKGKKNLITLGDIAFIRTGIKEGGYKEYILSKEKVSWMPVTRNIIPILKNVKSHPTINISRNDSFIIKNISKFRKKCEKRKSDILWLAARGHTHKCHRNVNRLPFAGNYFGIEPLDKDKEPLAIGILVSTLLILFSEILGRSKGIGGAAVTITKSDLKKLPVLNWNVLNVQEIGKINSAEGKLEKRIFFTIFEEFGLPKPNRDCSNIDANDVSLDKVMPDRRELDRIIFETLGLTEEEQLEVYRAVVELVKNRFVKARSV